MVVLVQNKSITVKNKASTDDSLNYNETSENAIKIQNKDNGAKTHDTEDDNDKSGDEIAENDDNIADNVDDIAEHDNNLEENDNELAENDNDFTAENDAIGK